MPYLYVFKLSVQQAHDQPFFRKPSMTSQSSLQQQQLADWVHQIYFDQKKLNQLSLIKLVEHPFQAAKPNIACSIMYSVIREKVQQVCKQIRQLIIQSYRKLMLRKQMNCDLKHSSDSWNTNFHKFRKANTHTNMNKVYGPIAHIICTYHNSLLNCNKQVYDLWKLLYQCSQVKDMQFKTLQSSLNQLILDQLMQDYPQDQCGLRPKEVMPTLSSFQKHEFIFKEMWGFQKRKLAVQFNSKSQQKISQSQGCPKVIKKASADLPTDNLPKRVQKNRALSPPMPILLSVKQVGTNNIPKSQPQLSPYQFSASFKQLKKQKALEQQIHLAQLQQQSYGIDSQTRVQILKKLIGYRKQPWFHEQKEQTIQSIIKIILGNLSEEQKLEVEKKLAEVLGGTIQIHMENGQQLANDNEQQNVSNDQKHSRQDHKRNKQDYQHSEQDQQIVQDKKQFAAKLGSILLNNNPRDLMIESKQQITKQLQQSKQPSKQGQFTETVGSDNNMNTGNQRYVYKQVRQRLQKISQAFKMAKCQEVLSAESASYIVQPAIRPSAYLGKQNGLLPDLIPINGKIQTTKQPVYEPITAQSMMSFRLDEQQPADQESTHNSADVQEIKPKKESLYEKLKKFYEFKVLDQNNDTQDIVPSQDSQTIQKMHKIQHNNQMKDQDTEIFYGKLSELTEVFSSSSDRESSKNITHSLLTGSKFSSKLQKMSQRQIVDQIYQIAKQKQKLNGGSFRKNDIKLTYKKFSYQVRSGEQRSQTKISKGRINAQDLNGDFWLDDLSQKAKYHLSQAAQFAQKLIDEPCQDLCQDLCQDDKQEKKKKKKKKKKNRNKKEASQQNDVNQKRSLSSVNDQSDLQTLQQFKKKSILDALDFKKMLSWPEGLDFQEYLENNEQMERIKEQQFLMQKKISKYQKSGERKTLSKQMKPKKQILNEDELKIFKFLQNLDIKDENRQKCVITQETIQKILYKRKLIKSKQMFQRMTLRAESAGLSAQKNKSNTPSNNQKDDLSNPKVNKPRNKKKKK